MGKIMCEFEENCTVFEILNGWSNAIQAVETTLCKGNHQSCARYVVRTTLGHDAVPSNLLPSDYLAAERLIEQAGQRP